jgi:drug/metabolite transporter (DMT)-like permease
MPAAVGDQVSVMWGFRSNLLPPCPQPTANVGYVLAAIALMTAQPFAVAFTQNGEGGYDYTVLSVNLLSETTKLLISLGVYCKLAPREHTHRLITARDVLQFAVPALLFALNNALLFAIVASIRPALFQLLSTTKTVFTAILFRLVLRRQLTGTQQAAVVILTAGAAVSRLNRSCAPEDDAGSGSGEVDQPFIRGEWVGVLLTLVTCISSSFGGVVNEALLKKDGAIHSLFLQNALLYAWGVLINGVALGVRSHESIAAIGFFGGYAPPVALLILTNAITGLSISAVLKHCDNLVRVFASGGSMIASMTIEALALQITPTPELVLAAVIVAGSAVVYAREGAPRPIKQPSVLLRAETAHVAEPASVELS